MLDHVFLTVSDLDRSREFYSKALEPLGLHHTVDYDGANGPPGHPDLLGFGDGTKFIVWLRHGDADARSAHVGFVASSDAAVDRAYAAAMAAGATDNGAPAERTYYAPGYYAGNVLDPDGYSLEFVHKAYLDP
jgi:catechol 2,3-dioxygenase-like lactoylglutathione lyase family enzyme